MPASPVTGAKAGEDAVIPGRSKRRKERRRKLAAKARAMLKPETQPADGADHRGRSRSPLREPANSARGPTPPRGAARGPRFAAEAEEHVYDPAQRVADIDKDAPRKKVDLKPAAQVVARDNEREKDRKGAGKKGTKDKRKGDGKGKARGKARKGGKGQG